jgi:TPR repeat protein
VAEIFISYKSERRPAARHLADVLKTFGYDAWYDYGLIPGEAFDSRLQAEMGAARVIVVLWCAMAVSSNWVQREARFARERGCYLPCAIQSVSLPQEFASQDTVDLSTWDGSPRSPKLDRLIDDIARRLDRAPAPDFYGQRNLQESWEAFGAPTLSKFAIEAAIPNRRDTLFSAASNVDAKAQAELELLQAKVEAKDPDALYSLGVKFRWGHNGLTKNLPEAARHFQMAAELKHAAAMHSLADLQHDGAGDLQKDDVEAVRLLKAAAEAGDATAHTALGRLHAAYDDRWGLPRSYKLAARYYHFAADQGDDWAQFSLAKLYEEGGFELDKDPREAVRYYGLACDQRHGEASARLGRMFEFGLPPVKKNLREAVRFYRLAVDAVLSNSWAQGRLASLYLKGAGGLRRDEREAVRLFRKAAEGRDTYSLTTLGTLYESGRCGLDKNLGEAIRLYKESAEMGSDVAKANLQRLGQRK